MPFSDWQDDGNYQAKDCYLLEYDDQGNVFRRPLADDDKRGPTGTEETGPHVSEVLADEAVQFIQSYADERPMFVYLAFPTPDDPRQAPRKYRAMYPAEGIELPPSAMPQHPFDNGHIVLGPRSGLGIGGRLVIAESTRVVAACRYACERFGLYAFAFFWVRFGFLLRTTCCRWMVLAHMSDCRAAWLISSMRER